MPPPPAPAPAKPAAGAQDGRVDAAEDTTASDGARAGAVKAARAALAAARDAARRVQGAGEDQPTNATPQAAGTPSSGAPSSGAKSAKAAGAARSGGASESQMHYTAGGVRLTADGGPGAGGQAAPGPAGAARPAASAPVSGPRRVRLTVSRVDPWSIMKLAFLLAVAIGIMTVVAAAVFWYVLDGLQVFDKVQQFINEVVGQQTNVDLTQFVAFDRVVSLATLVAVVNVVLLTALSTIMALLYNITAALVGGVHVTLTDD
ncbi:DUF3566 domain-containing protein [Xylanimonas ulmi]|uniref:DUF3566 domain-containing protein n=1 Tax=Xylanimonas ulmi TaxID=228973 RepID=UPI001F5FED45|nr:DUF3566 domain-containing protein [Xylanibacterium ulmi]